MEYKQRISARIGRTIGKRWGEWKNKRRLRDYYQSQNLVEPRFPRFLRDVFAFLVLFLLFFWYAPTLNIAFWGFIVTLAVIVFWRLSRQQRKYLQLKKSCFQKVAVREYQKRLEKTSHEVLLEILREEIKKKFAVSSLEISNGFLEGRLLGEKLVIAYLDVDREDTASTREVLAVVRKCFQRGISQVRIFTNGDFAPASFNPGQCYQISLRLYNGDDLQYLLKNTLLFPSVSEIKEIINYEKLKRQKKMSSLKKEILKKQKVTGYLLYSLLLFLMAWFRLGIVYLNIVAGIVMLGFALLTLIKNSQVREKERAEIASFSREDF